MIEISYVFLGEVDATAPPVKRSISPETLGLGLGLLGVVIFGATLPMTRLAVADLDPYCLTAGRAAGAGLLASLVLLGVRRPLPSTAQLKRIAVAAVMLVGGFPGFSGIAMQTIPAAHAGVVVGSLPLATAVAATVLARERPSFGFWMCSFCGAVLVTAYALRQGGGRFAWGDGLLLCAVASAAVGYTIFGLLARDMPGWEVISWAVVITLPLTLPLTLLYWPAAPAAVHAASWWAFAYLAAMSMYLGFFAWNAGLALAGVARVSQVQLLQTFVTLVISSLVLKENIDRDTIVYAIAVVGLVFVGRSFAISRPVGVVR